MRALVFVLAVVINSTFGYRVIQLDRDFARGFVKEVMHNEQTNKSWISQLIDYRMPVSDEKYPGLEYIFFNEIK